MFGIIACQPAAVPMRLPGDMLMDIDKMLSIALEFALDHTIVTAEEKNEELKIVHNVREP